MRARRSAALGVLAILVLGALVPFLLAPRAEAGPEPPSLLATAYNTQRKLVAAPDGTLFVAITANVSGVPAARVYSTRDGSTWTPLPPPPTSGNASDRTTLAIDSTGRLHLAWTEVVSVDRQVFYARFEGGAWVGKIQLSHSPGYAGFPSIAVDVRDRAHVAWYATDGMNYQIYYRRLEPSGWTAERALTFTTVDATNPAIALGPDGTVHLAWARFATRGFTEIAYLRLEGDTVVETQPISESGVDSLAPSIVVDSAGTVHVVWDAAGRIQYITRSTSWSQIAPISPTTITARNPSLALDAGNRLHVFWEGSDRAIHAQVGNGSWSPPDVVSTGGNNTYPNARWSQFDNPLCGANGGIDVVWTEDVGGSLRLAYRRVDAPAECPADLTVPLVVALVAIPAAIAILLFIRYRRRLRAPPERPNPP